VAPGAGGIAAADGAYDRRAAVDINGVGVFAAILRAAPEGWAGNHLAVATTVGIAPGRAFAGAPALEGGKFGLVGVKSVTLIERPADRPARAGRNPRTGDSVTVAEKHIPFFKTGKQVRDRLNQSAGHA